MTQNVPRTKLAQYLTLIKVSSNSIGWLIDEQNWVERKIKINKENKKKIEEIQ